MRARERQGAAALRAVGAEPRAEYRAHQLTVGDRTVPLAAPWLTIDHESAEALDDRVYRGLVDALGVRLRYSNRVLHAAGEPHDLVARIVFDVLEQVRCEAQVPDALDGVRDNIEHAFRAWCARQNITDSALGLLLYTVLHMARSRMVHPLQNELIEDTIESTRANVSPVIGTGLRHLKANTDDQVEYAYHARGVAEAIAEMVDEQGGGEMAAGAEKVATQLFIPPDWTEDPPEGDGDMAGAGSDVDRVDERSLDEVGGYHVFTREHDVEQTGASLYPEARRRELREHLDEEIAAQAVSVFTLARRFQRLLTGLERDGWSHGQEDGILDAARLSQIVANPAQRQVFQRERYRITCPAVVSFLIDNSGSMKRQRHETVTVLVDTLARALDLAGATSEILGFTTNAWNGGEPLREWRRAMEPQDPGRLAELSHIVYKDADTPWKRSRLSMASMMRTQHFREGVDGEAIAWAYRRLLARPEPKKLLLIVSDGAPMEAATINANGEAFLEAHLANVVHRIERDPRVDIGAIAIDQPVDDFFSRSVDIDLSGTLTLASYRVLERLFL
jgi:cobaltochelatase CobT